MRDEPPAARRWQEFVEASWRRAPAKLARVFAPGLLSHREIFGALIRARSRTDARFHFNAEATPGRYTRQGQAPVRESELPREADGSIGDYAARLKRDRRGARFCLRLVSAERDDPLFARGVDALFADFDRTLGRSTRKNTVVFVGDYDFTPVGVHTDAEPIMQAVLLGRKRAHFWTPERWNRESRDPHAPTRYLSEATSHDLAAGDMVYWPEGQYHVFETLELAVGISVGFPDEIAERDDDALMGHDGRRRDSEGGGERSP